MAYVVVAESMILANTELAKWCRARSLPMLWRVHGPPDDDEGLANAVGFIGDAGAADEDAMAAISLALGHQFRPGRARYSVEPSPHWGLGLGLYMHATSPLRRAADLISQSNLIAYLRHDPIPFPPERLAEIATELNATREAALDARAEREKKKDDRRTARLAKEPGVFAREPRLVRRSCSVHNRYPGTITAHRLVEILEEAEDLGTNMDGVYWRLIDTPDTEGRDALREHVLDRFVADPSMAAEVYHQRLASGDESMREGYTAERDGGSFTVKAMGTWGAQKKEAEQRAYVAHYAAHLGLEDLLPDEWFRDEGVEAEASMEEETQIDVSGDAIMRLNELKQKSGAAITYEFERVEADGHEGTWPWRCTARLVPESGGDGIDASGIASTKKTAKAMAATLILVGHEKG
jgi:ribonuclease R